MIFKNFKGTKTIKHPKSTKNPILQQFLGFQHDQVFNK